MGIEITNRIFWGSGNNPIDFYSNTNSPILDKNIIEGGCPANSTCSDVITADPMLGVLGDYGGSTQTIPLGASSSAIDTADNTYTTCPATDQRGVSRPQNAICDIGPFEVNIPRYRLTVAKGGTDSGSVSGTNISCGSNCTEYYFEDEEITLTATSNANSSFTGWSDVCTGTGPCTVTMTAAKNVTANFNLLPQINMHSQSV